MRGCDTKVVINNWNQIYQLPDKGLSCCSVPGRSKFDSNQQLSYCYCRQRNVIIILY